MYVTPSLVRKPENLLSGSCLFLKLEDLFLRFLIQVRDDTERK